MKLAIIQNLENPTSEFVDVVFCQEKQQWVAAKEEDTSFVCALREKSGLKNNEPDSPDADIKLLETAGKRNLGINFISKQSCNTTN